MPNKPAQPPTLLISQIGFRASEGAGLDPTTQVQSLPAIAPAVSSNASTALNIIGLDIAQFSVVITPADTPVNIAATQTITFPNLPTRNNTQNSLNLPTSSAQQPFSVLPINLLLFVAFVQGLSAPNGTIVSLAPQAITTNNTYVPGPVLGPDVYQTFQVVVSVTGPTAATITGTVVGLVAQYTG